MYWTPKVSKYNYTFPDANEADDEGLVAWGEDLDVERILSAYRNGIFPWFNEGNPVLWWSPNPRLILYPNDLKVSKSLKKSIKKFEVKFNNDFESVIRACRDVRKKKEGSWITETLIEKYAEIHKQKIAHCVETYYEGKLVGGLYGLEMGNIFCGESMFAKKNDASKVAFYHLIERLKKQNFYMVDCQIPTDHLKSLGAVEISRKSFLEKLRKGLNKPVHFDTECLNIS